MNNVTNLDRQQTRNVKWNYAAIEIISNNRL